MRFRRLLKRGYRSKERKQSVGVRSLEKTRSTYGVADGRFSQEAGLSHHLDSLDGVGSLGGLSGQHDTVSSVQDSVGDILKDG